MLSIFVGNPVPRSVEGLHYLFVACALFVTRHYWPIASNALPPCLPALSSFVAAYWSLRCLLPRLWAGHTADTVYNMLEDSQGSKFSEAGVHLRTAAGIFERLHKVGSTWRHSFFACFGEAK